MKQIIKIISISLITLTLLTICHIPFTEDIEIEDSNNKQITQVAAEKVTVSIKIRDSETGEITQDLKEVIDNTNVVEVTY